MNLTQLITSTLAAAGLLASAPEVFAQAGKKQDAGGLEVLITGEDVYSLPDHTARPIPDEFGTPFTSHVCRNANFGTTAVGLRKTIVALPIPDNVGACVPGGLYLRAFSVGFKSIPARSGSAVNFSTWVEHNLQISVSGVVTSGQWPPANGQSVTVTVPAGATWSFSSVGGWPKACGKVTFPNPSVFTIQLTRNNSRSDTPCDCPFDYSEEEGGLYGVCDPDQDGVIVGDNCPFTFNPEQLDADMDGIGDACSAP